MSEELITPTPLPEEDINSPLPATEASELAPSPPAFARGLLRVNAYRWWKGDVLPVTKEDTMSEEPITPTQSPEEDFDPTPLIVEENEPAPLAEEGLEPTSPPEEIDAALTSEADIEAVRALILALHPAIVPELIGGDSVATLIESITPAQEAYSRIVAAVRVPAGGNGPTALDVESLSTFEKIRRGIKVSEVRGARA